MHIHFTSDISHIVRWLALASFLINYFLRSLSFYLSLTFAWTASNEVFDLAGRLQKVFLQFIEVDRLLELVSF